MRTFNWLHVTDLHLGMSGQDHLWPNIREAFYKDLGELHEKCGPWHALLFSGDLVQRGSPDEFQRLEPLLVELWEKLSSLGSNPVLLAVPGNHDLVRPDANSPAAMVLSRWQEFPDIHGAFWGGDDSAYRSVIEQAFANYQQWWSGTPFRQNVEVHSGFLPGDFSATLDIDGFKIGIVGLNTTFLQLGDGDYCGHLIWHTRQFHDACGGDGPKWVNEHHASILMTHQGPEWLTNDSRTNVYAEINPAGRFAVHLFGHMHENVVRSMAHGGGSTLRSWQGNSLFGLEHYGDTSKEDRRHGYSAGQLQINESGGQIRHWPRMARRYVSDGWIIIPDYESCILEDDQGTRPEPIDVPLLAKKVKIEVEEPHRTPSSVAGDAVQIWKEKLWYFQKELAKASDPAMKFNLRKLIADAQNEIRKLEP